jgi:hypothetical protein
MRKEKKQMRKLVALILVVSMSSSLHAQWFDWGFPLVPRADDGSPNLTAPVPRVADDRVDLSGLWVPEKASGSLYDSSRIKGWALDAIAEAERNFHSTAPRFDCLPSGPSTYPAEVLAGGMRRIVQHPEIIAILNSDMTYRQIFMDGRGLVEEPLLPSWMGYAVGRWEGDTLVVKSNGYNDKTWLTQEGLPHTDRLQITERYTRLDYGRMKLEITYEDAGTFIEPVQATIDLALRPESVMLEVICNESKTSRRHYGGVMDQYEEQVVVVPEKILEEYVGTYQGLWANRRVTVEIELKKGELVLKRTPRYVKIGGNTDFDIAHLVARSETAFDSSLGLGWIFNRNAVGEVVRVSEVHVSGSWSFERVK